MPADGKTIDDPELLMEAMEAREELHEASTIQAIDGPRREITRRDEILSRKVAQFVLGNDRPAIRKAPFACATSTSSPRRRGRMHQFGTQGQSGKQGRAKLEIHEPGERRRMPARARWRSASISARPTCRRHRARGQACRPARRDGQGAGPVGCRLSRSGRRAGRRGSAPADGARAQERRRLGEAPDVAAARPICIPWPACCPTRSSRVPGRPTW